MVEIKKCTLKELKFQQYDYLLEMYVPLHIAADHSQLQLTLVSRYRGLEETYYVFELSRSEEICIFGSKIERKELDHLMLHDDIWDVYLTKEKITELDTEEDEETEEPLRYRLMSNLKHIELLYYINHKENKILLPYSTNKGNLSFQVKNPGIIAKVERASIDKSGLISLSGFAVDPTGKDQIEKRTFILRNSGQGIELKYPVQFIERADLTEEYGHHGLDFNHAGFYAEIKAEDIALLGEGKVRYKSYLKMDVDGEVKETPRLKLIPDSSFSRVEKYIKKFDGRKKKFVVTRTKKKKFLSISVDDYRFSTHVKSLLKKKLRKIKKSKYTKRAYQLAFKIIGMLPADKKLVMFESFLGKQYSDNPRAIYEYMKENLHGYKLYWSIDKRFIYNFENRNLVYIKRFSIKWLFAMARARYWVTNSRMPLWIPKPAHTIYLQTWHGTPLKKLAADMEEVHMPGTTTEKYKRNFLKEASNWDYLISPNAYSTEIFRRAFQFNKEMLETGYPRNDFLFTNNNAEEIRAFKAKYGLPEDKKVILYAPTWRDNQFYGKGRYKFDLPLDLDKLREKLGDQYIIVVRMHYLVASSLDLTPYAGFTYDFSNHEDIRELYLIADLLITDYSSVFFDYANLRRPMIFFVYDIDDYRDNLRGFYFDFEKNAPGPLVKTTDEVIREIQKLDVNGYQLPETFEAFYKRFCYLESGKSSQKVVERVFLGRKEI
ncbi:CDP-glycerol:poly(glycerophosphate) glycerophosphotransferase [Weizmannia acidilactici]|uniref:CDP-glycerol:poly(Glycerophosphate) glycerophosphotransferase n=1 Tax=Weizmannia acidilactici TaxID=2607726 RepID=A0A5J4JC84_9BACI|nr:CDP-glycerol glycerophosphotransferase family protein [Weizmannia acidilactici]GER68829.1 CDP-glycerol:poly(glycerophosphate) glycerophosphotransferase [Weizmannia acidilactici]GER72886.1 CDP-glycerol:poly(glycerophosphate) glycerophosphotransferase [Weizmannia acidilactici]